MMGEALAAHKKPMTELWRLREVQEQIVKLEEQLIRQNAVIISQQDTIALLVERLSAQGEPEESKPRGTL